MSDSVTLIERIEKQDGPQGTHVSMPPSPANPEGLLYHFAPCTRGEETIYVAAVTDLAHKTRFLDFPGIFREVEPLPAEAQADGGEEQGPAAVGLPAPVSEPQPPASGVPPVSTLEELDLGALRKQFKLELGRNPSPKSTADTLIAQIKTKRAEAPQ